MVTMLTTFLSGVAVGFAIAVYLLLYILSFNSPKQTEETVAIRSTKSVYEEEPPTEESRKLLKEAIKYLACIQEGRDISPSIVLEDEGTAPNCTLYQLEQIFDSFCTGSKDRLKNLKCLSIFTSDVGRAYAIFAKDLSKISSSARSNVKSIDQQQIAKKGSNLDDVNTSERITDCTNEWWKTLSSCLSHLSNDTEELSELMIADCSMQITHICDAFVSDEKKLIAEGSKLLNQLKDGLLKNEHLSQDRDKLRIKASSAGQADDYNRKGTRLQQSELALSENMKIVQHYKNDFKAQMPQIFSNFRSASTKFLASMKIQLMKVADLIRRQNTCSNSITQRLKSQIGATGILVKAGEIPKTLMGFEPMLQNVLTAEAEAATEEFSDVPRISSLPPSSSLNMASESTACLAASAPAVLPPLPSSFGRCVKEETCVWFNAFSGRIYRDAARSEYFHAWLLSKLTTQLNKGAKPGFIDEVVVESVTFGSTPPLLMNVKWSPATSQAKSKNKNGSRKSANGSNSNNNSSSSSCNNNNSSGSGGFNEIDKGESSNEDMSDKEINTASFPSSDSSPTNTETSVDAADSDSSTFNVTVTTEDISDALHGPQGGARKNHTSVSPPIQSDHQKSSTRDPTPELPSSSSTSSTEHSHTSTSSSSSPSDFSDEDIECTADMAYRSGLKFKISTRLWCNWPRDRYASIPVTLILELVEISGRVRFGVTHSASYFTFLEEPHTRFAVHSEVGGDTFKLKDIPTLSDYIVKKLKDFILKKFVDPSCHSFRLIWPRSWWPLDVQQKHSGTGSAPQDPVDSTSTSTTLIATTTASATTSKISVTLDMKSDMKNEIKNEVKNEKKSGFKGDVRGGNGLQDGSIIVSGILGPSSNSRTLQASTFSPFPEGLPSLSSSISTITTTTTTSTTTSSTSSAASVVGSDEGTARPVISSTPVAQPQPLPLSTAAAAAIASFSSTTAGWLREEVRRRGQPVSAQSTPTNSPPSLPLPVTSPSPSPLCKLDSVTDVLKAEKDCTSLTDVAVGDVKRTDESNAINGPRNHNTTSDKHENVRQIDNHHDELKNHGKHDKSVVHSSEISKEGNMSGAGEHNLWPAFLQNSSIPHFLHRKSHSLSHSQSHSQSNSHSQSISSLEANSPESGRMKAFAKINDLKSQSLETLADTLLGPRGDVSTMKNNAMVVEHNTDSNYNNNNNTDSNNNNNNSNSNSSVNNDINHNKSSPSSNDVLVGNVLLSTLDVSAQDNDPAPKGTECSSDILPALSSPVQSSSSSSSVAQDVNKCNGSRGISPTDEKAALHKMSIDVEESKSLDIAPAPMSTPMPAAQPALSPVHSDQLSSSSIIHMNATVTAASYHSEINPGEPMYDTKEATRSATLSSDTVTISPPQHHNHSSPSSDTTNFLPVQSTSPLTLSQETSAAANTKVQLQQQQQQQLKVGEREEKINPGKDKYVEKSEWFNKLGEAKEKFQNKFSVFKSKLVHLPGAALSPSSHLNSPNTSSSLSDILLPKLTDATVVSAKPVRTNSTADPQQPPVTYKSALPELLISAISSLTSPSPSPSHHSTAVGTWVGAGTGTGTGTAISTVQTRGILVDSGSAGAGASGVGGGGGAGIGGGGGVDSTRHKNIRSFSPITRHIQDPILRARSTSDASSHSMRPESDPLGSSRNRRALSVGTFESAFSAPKAAELSHSAKNKNLNLNLNLKGSFKSTLKATTTPQERRYNMYKHFEMSLADRENDEGGLDELIIPTSFNAVGKFGMLSSDAKLISLCGSEMSPNAAVMMYEQQLTSTERSESSFSPGDHRAPALSRMGVLWAPPNTERMWAELSIGGRYGKASLQLYFVGDKCPQGMDADDSRKTVSFLDHTDRASIGVFDYSTSTGTGDDSSYSNSNSSSSIGSCAGPGTGAAAGSQGSKMVLAASYDLQDAECRQLPRSTNDEASTEQPQLSLHSITEDTRASVPHTAGFEILLHTDRKKWIPFICPTEEDCDDWMDAIDNVAHV